MRSVSTEEPQGSLIFVSDAGPYSKIILSVTGIYLCAIIARRTMNRIAIILPKRDIKYHLTMGMPEIE